MRAMFDFAAQIPAAREVLSRYFPPTKLLAAESLDGVWFKLESDLPTGSFKPRGALYALAVNLGRREIREVAASSTGNHGAAVAWAAKTLGVPARIFLPENPNPVKRARIARLGATIVESGRDISHAFDRAAEYSRRDGVYLLDDASDPDLPAGPATIACEILEQAPWTERIYVPVGDTALIRGVAAAAKAVDPAIRIIGVQTENAPSYYLSWNSGQATPTDTCDTIADGLATRTPRQPNVDAIRDLVDEMRLVSESQMLAAIRHLLIEEHILAEPAGAAATAAILAEGAPGPSVSLVTGANIAEPILRRALSISA